MCFKNRRVRNRTHGGVGGRGRRLPLLPDHQANEYRQVDKGRHRSREVHRMAPFYAFSWFGVSTRGMRYCNSASGVLEVSLALKGLHIIAQGKRGATLGWVDKTKPILNSASGVLGVSLALKGLHIIAQGKRGATLGRADKTKPILTLKGLHKIRISPIRAILRAGRAARSRHTRR
jgi:hypothetical protein